MRPRLRPNTFVLDQAMSVGGACQNVVLPLKPRTAIQDRLNIVADGQHPKSGLHRQPTAPKDGLATVAAEALRSGYQAHEHSKNKYELEMPTGTVGRTIEARVKPYAAQPRSVWKAEGWGPPPARANSQEQPARVGPHRQFSPQSLHPAIRGPVGAALAATQRQPTRGNSLPRRAPPAIQRLIAT
jgi:hypothetical protein